MTAINATLRTEVVGLRLGEDCNAFVRMSKGAAGTVACSQVAYGQDERDAFAHLWRARISGVAAAGSESADCEMARQAGGDSLYVDGYVGGDAWAVARTPAGHPEGSLEAFAVLYRESADALTEWKQGNRSPLPATLLGIEACMRFIDRVIESNRKEGWVHLWRRALSRSGTMKKITTDNHVLRFDHRPLPPSRFPLSADSATLYLDFDSELQVVTSLHSATNLQPIA